MLHVATAVARTVAGWILNAQVIGLPLVFVSAAADDEWEQQEEGVGVPKGLRCGMVKEAPSGWCQLGSSCWLLGSGCKKAPPNLGGGGRSVPVELPSSTRVMAGPVEGHKKARHGELLPFLGGAGSSCVMSRREGAGTGAHTRGLSKQPFSQGQTPNNSTAGVSHCRKVAPRVQH